MNSINLENPLPAVPRPFPSEICINHQEFHKFWKFVASRSPGNRSPMSAQQNWPGQYFPVVQPLLLSAVVPRAHKTSACGKYETRFPLHNDNLNIWNAIFTTQPYSENLKREFHYTATIWKSETRFSLHNDIPKLWNAIPTIQPALQIAKSQNCILRFAHSKSPNVKLAFFLYLKTSQCRASPKMAATTRSRSRWQRLRCVVARDGSDYAAQSPKMAATTLCSRSKWQRLRCVVAQDGGDYAATEVFRLRCSDYGVLSKAPWINVSCVNILKAVSPKPLISVRCSEV